MNRRMDRGVARILETLSRCGLKKNTIVVFSSDNGPSPEGGQSLKFFNSAGPLSGAKRTWREGGIRVPMIARWKGKIKPGRTSDHPSAFWDFLPTACEVAGIEAPADIDGIVAGLTAQPVRHGLAGDQVSFRLSPRQRLAPRHGRIEGLIRAGRVVLDIAPVPSSFAVPVTEIHETVFADSFAPAQKLPECLVQVRFISAKGVRPPGKNGADGPGPAVPLRRARSKQGLLHPRIEYRAGGSALEIHGKSSGQANPGADFVPAAVAPEVQAVQ
jgi:hypothetical protein